METRTAAELANSSDWWDLAAYPVGGWGKTHYTDFADNGSLYITASRLVVGATGEDGIRVVSRRFHHEQRFELRAKKEE